jgi:hypothetical protein
MEEPIVPTLGIEQLNELPLTSPPKECGGSYGVWDVPPELCTLVLGDFYALGVIQD